MINEISHAFAHWIRFRVIVLRVRGGREVEVEFLAGLVERVVVEVG